MRLVSFSLAGAHTSLIFGIKLGIPPGAAIALIRLAGLVHRWQASRLPLLANELRSASFLTTIGEYPPAPSPG